MNQDWTNGPSCSQYAPTFSQYSKQRIDLPICLDSSEFTTDELEYQELQEKLGILKKNLDALNDEKGKAKGVRQLQEIKNVCVLLLRRVAGSVFAHPANPIYSLEEIVSDLIVACEQELSKNESKYQKNHASQMDFTSTEMCLEFVRTLVAKKLANEQIEITRLCISLQKSIFNTVDGRFENATCELLVKYSEKVPIVEWKTSHFNLLLQKSQCELLARLSTPITWKRAETWAKVITLLVKNAKWHNTEARPGATTFAFVLKIVEVLEKHGTDFWKKRTTYTSAIFDLFSIFIDEWGILYWDIITPRFLDICQASIDQLNGIWSSVLAIQDKFAVETAGRAFWSFLERALALGASGGEMVIPVCAEKITTLANDIFLSITSELTKACNSNSRTPFELPDSRIALISRLLCLCESGNVKDFNKSAKRSRYLSPLETFCDCDWEGPNQASLTSVTLRSLHAFFELYSTKIASKIEEITERFWNSRAKFSGFTDMYCNILAIILERENLCNNQLCHSILEWVFGEGMGPGAAHLCANILVRFPVDSLSLNQILEFLSRNQISSKYEHNLLGFALERCKIDEFSSIPSQMHGQNFPKSRHTPFFEPWKFRQELIEYLLMTSTVDIADIVTQLMTYYCNQGTIYEKPGSDSHKTFEDNLCSFMLIGSGSLQCKAKEEKQPNIYIPDLVKTCAQLFTIIWDKESSFVRKLFLWRQLGLLYGILTKNQAQEAIGVFESLVEKTKKWLFNNYTQITDHSWDLLDLGEFSTCLGKEIKNLIMEQAHINERAFVALIRDPKVQAVELGSDFEEKVLEICFTKKHRDQAFQEGLSQLLLNKIAKSPCEDWIQLLEKYAAHIVDEDKQSLLENLMQWNPEDNEMPENAEAIRNQFLIAQIVYEPSSSYQRRASILPLIDPMTVTSRFTELSPTASAEIFEQLLNYKAFLPKVVGDFLNKRFVWSKHLHLLCLILRNDELLEICMKRVPDFLRVVQFYSVSLLLLVEPWPSHPEIRPFRLLMTDEFVTCMKRMSKDLQKLPTALTTNCFPSAFRCEERFFPMISSSFSSLLRNGGALELLPLIRLEAARSVECFQEARFLNLLNSITESVLKLLGSSQNILFPFLETAITSLSFVWNHIILESLPILEMQEFARQRKQLLALMPSDISMCSVIVSKEMLLNFKGSSTDSQTDFFVEAAQSFINGKWPVDEHIFFCLTFWSALEKALNEKELQMENLSECLDNIMFVWDAVEWLRAHIAPSISILMNLNPSVTPYTFEFSTKKGDEYFLKHLYRFCRLILANYRETNFEKIRFALRLMCCSEFKELKILTPELVDKGISSLCLESIPMSQALSQPASSSFAIPTNIIEACLILLRGLDMENAVIRTLIKNITNMPSLSMILLPILCALDHSDEIMSLAIPTILQCEQWTGKDASSRTSRCLSECLDAISIEQLSSRKETITNTERLYALAEILIADGYTKHAKLLFHLYCERALSSKRFDLGFTLGYSLCVLPAEACEFAARLNTKTKDASTLKILPSDIQMRPPIQRVLLTDAHDWVRLLADENIETQFTAASAMGLNLSMKVNDELEKMMYRDAWQMRNWKSVPFPKRADSHDMKLYSLLYMENSTSKWNTLEGNGAFMKEEIHTKLANSTIVSSDLCKQEQELKFFEQQFLDDEVTDKNSNKGLASARAFINWRSAINSRKTKTMKQWAQSIFSYVDELIDSRKFKPAIVHLQDLKEICSTMESDPKMTRLAKECSLKECIIKVKTKSYLEAKNLLNQLVTSQQDLEVSSQAFCQLADLAQVNGEGLDSALECAKKAEELCAVSQKMATEKKAIVYRKLFETCCSQLENVESYRESKGFRMKHDAVVHWDTVLKEQVDKRRRQESGLMDQGTLVRIRRERRCEIEAISQTRIKMWRFAESAITSGLQAISLAPKEQAPQILFSVIDLLFRYGEENTERDNLLDDEEEIRRGEEMPSHASIVNLFMNSFSHFDTSKWVLAVSHICSHAFRKTPLGEAIKKVMIELVIAHPYHTVNTLLFYEDGAEKSPIVMEILKAAMNGRRKLADKIKALRTAHRIYKNFCQIEIDKDPQFQLVQKPGKTLFIANQQKCELFQNRSLLSQLPLPIIDPEALHFDEQSEQALVCWGSINPCCQKADGQSRPILLDVVGSDGKNYRLVFKKEDVRQDSLVEQLFSVVNTILATDKDPQPLRTYKVMPLSEKTGIIEFCMGTTSMKSLLCGEDRESGLHQKIHPQDLSCKSAISMMAKSVKPNTSTNDALQMFDDICKRMRPVFRHHFYESFPTTSEWIAQLDAYTTSLAHWCIVCYVIGLGDRHMSNILFEPQTSRFVHIDLGMILEYSKRTLPVPEHVPFRLTRDLTDPLLPDGMGHLVDRMTKTMETLRSNHRVILGLASVFLREFMSNFKEAHNTQSYTSMTAIARLRDKLNGTDASLIEQSPEQQVRRLIQEATNKENLARIYCGWMPFL
ncbi:unnamed protein product, partial [Mesorhabditis belari]|uniref:non-specific serine/threonine protein kinase n=1 Tax=Mesorhabditis belari TaxID=2138241 RepID=A0AAF3FC97_9BILA